MKNTIKMLSKFLATGILLSGIIACKSCQPTHEFAYDAPVKAMIFELPFPTDSFYQSTPDAKIIVGKKDLRSPIEQANAINAPNYEISGFEVATGKKLWQLPLQGEVVGETEKQILIYEAETFKLHFVNPADGKITREISPAPNPLLSKNGFENGMAFTDDIYLTTKALYTTAYENAKDWENRREDASFKIGITAKNWKNDKVKWFLPAVKQIVTIENRPVIFGDKVFIINPPQTIDGEQTYQIASLETGAEIFRGATIGKFSHIGKDIFIEQTDSFVRRFEPLSGAEIWKFEDNFHNAAVRAIGNQITIAAPHNDGTRTIFLVDAATGKSIEKFEFPSTGNTPLNGCFLTADKQILCNFVAELNTDILHRDFNYWTAYDASAKKISWRTAFNSQAVSSLFPFANDKVKFE